MYFDLPITPGGEEEILTLCIPFNQAPDSPLPLQPHDIRLGCTPVVNLFPRTAEPLMVDHRRSEYRLVADHHDKNIQIYRVQALWLSHQQRPATYRRTTQRRGTATPAGSGTRGATTKRITRCG